MPTEVVMPQMGESIAEGTITNWLVKVGDKVERDQPLFVISTDKVDAEIPSPAGGVVLELKFDEGATVPINEVVALIGEEGEKVAPKAEAPSPEPGSAPSAAPDPAPVAASVPAAKATTTTEPIPEPPAAIKPAATPGDLAGALSDVDADLETLEQRVKKYSSPVVRKIAEAEGIDITRIEGSGIHGRVTKKDIDAFIAAGGQGAPAPSAPPAVAAAIPPSAPAAPAAPAAARPTSGFSVPAYTASERVEIVPMSKIRQITAAHMRYSKDTSAHVTTAFHIDMSGVHAARTQAKDGFLKANGTKLTYMPFIFKAVSSALRRHKKLNAAIDGTHIVYKKDINLGMAVALEKGLIVPVIRQADTLSLVGLAKGANDLADRARTRRLKPDEVQGGTFTITNPGVFGSLWGTPIINQPQVAILGLGTIEKRPVVVTDEFGNDGIAIRVMSYFAITYDHRLVDGSDADHFMNDVKKTLQEETWKELDAYR